MHAKFFPRSVRAMILAKLNKAIVSVSSDRVDVLSRATRVCPLVRESVPPVFQENLAGRLPSDKIFFIFSL